MGHEDSYRTTEELADRVIGHARLLCYFAEYGLDATDCDLGADAVSKALTPNLYHLWHDLVELDRRHCLEIKQAHGEKPAPTKERDPDTEFADHFINFLMDMATSPRIKEYPEAGKALAVGVIALAEGIKKAAKIVTEDALAAKGGDND